MKSFQLILALIILSSATVAIARPCGESDYRLLFTALRTRASDQTIAPGDRSAANFAMALIFNNPRPICNVESGIAGNAYAIKTTTHNLEINFFEAQITQVQVQGTRSH